MTSSIGVITNHSPGLHSSVVGNVSRPEFMFFHWRLQNPEHKFRSKIRYMGFHQVSSFWSSRRRLEINSKELQIWPRKARGSMAELLMAFDCIWHYLRSFDKTPAYSSQNKAVNLNLLELLSVSGFRLQPGVYGRLWVPLLQKWPKVANIFFHLEWTWSVQTSETKLAWMFESWMILSKESLAIAGWNLHPVLQVWPCIVFVPSSQGNPHIVALDVYKKPFKRQDTVVTHDTWMLRMLLECHGSCTLDRITTALVARHNRKLWDVLRAIWIGRISYFTTYLSQGLGAARFNLWEGAGIQGRHIGIILESHLPYITRMSWLWIPDSRMLLLIMRKPGSSAMRLLLLSVETLVLFADHDSYDHRRSYGCKAEAIAWPSTTWKQNAS